MSEVGPIDGQNNGFEGNEVSASVEAERAERIRRVGRAADFVLQFDPDTMDNLSEAVDEVLEYAKEDIEYDIEQETNKTPLRRKIEQIALFVGVGVVAAFTAESLFRSIFRNPRF